MSGSSSNGPEAANAVDILSRVPVAATLGAATAFAAGGADALAVNAMEATHVLTDGNYTNPAELGLALIPFGVAIGLGASFAHKANGAHLAGHNIRGYLYRAASVGCFATAGAMTQFAEVIRPDVPMYQKVGEVAVVAATFGLAGLAAQTGYFALEQASA